jgi:hypothetical protein
LNKEILQGPRKKNKALRYGPFEAVEKVGDNTYRLNLPPYMRIYLVVNVENLKLYDPSILHQEEELVEEIFFSKLVQNYKTGEALPLADWVERTTSRQSKMIHQGEHRGNISSPHSIKILGTKRISK